jgi:hypothetical protein
LGGFLARTRFSRAMPTDKMWAEMDGAEQQAVQVIGWTQGTWDAGTDSTPFKLAWEGDGGLNEAQRSAAAVLDYGPEDFGQPPSDEEEDDEELFGSAAEAPAAPAIQDAGSDSDGSDVELFVDVAAAPAPAPAPALAPAPAPAQTTDYSAFYSADAASTVAAATTPAATTPAPASPRPPPHRSSLPPSEGVPPPRGVTAPEAVTPTARGGASSRDAAAAAAARNAPRWIPDAEAESCMLCEPGWKFWGVGPSTWTRHHCRCCGLVVCQKCMPEGQTAEVSVWLSSGAGHPLQRRQQPEQQRACNSCLAAARPRMAARAQGFNAAALAVRGHPTPVYNTVYTLSKQVQDGWPVYETRPGGGDLYLTRHVQSECWVLCPARSLAAEQLPKAATIRSPEGRVPLGSHTWARGGATIEIRVAELATQTDAEVEAAHFAAEKAAEAQPRLSAMHQQLAGIAGVRIEGMPIRAYNTVYSAAGRLEGGWLCFKTSPQAAGERPYHLYYFYEGNKWILNDSLTPDQDAAKAFANSPSGLLPCGTGSADAAGGGGTAAVPEWSVWDNVGCRWESAKVQVSLLSDSHSEGTPSS